MIIFTILLVDVECLLLHPHICQNKKKKSNLTPVKLN